MKKFYLKPAALAAAVAAALLFAACGENSNTPSDTTAPNAHETGSPAANPGQPGTDSPSTEPEHFPSKTETSATEPEFSLPETESPATEPEFTPSETESPPTESEPPEDDDEPLDVELTYTVEYLTADGTPEASLATDEYLAAHGYKSIEDNGDGTVSFIVSREKYEEMLAESDEKMRRLFEGLITEDTPYIKSIEPNEDYTVVTVTVDRDEYESAADVTELAIATYMSLRAESLGELDSPFTIEFADAKTSLVYKTKAY